MSVSSRAVLTAVVASLVAVAAYVGVPALVALAAVLVLLVTIGWPALVDAPARRGTSVVIGLGGLGGVLAVAATGDEPFLRDLPEVLALSVLAAFVHELVRRDGRERLVESVAGGVSGVLVAAAAAGWVAAGRADEGIPVVVTGALALAVGSAVSAAVSAVHVAGWLGATLTVVAAAGAGAGAGQLVPGVDPLPGGLIGLAVGILVAALHRLLDGLPSTGRRWPALAGAVVPVTVSGIVVSVVGRVLVG